MKKLKPIVLLGPTATGKTALSIELAKQIDGEIISLDSALIYKDMNIGTAKPTIAERCNIPHHLIDICLPTASYSAADFREDCIRLVNEIYARGKRPIICGGTMMYYKALVDGLSNVPKSTPEIRAFMQAELEKNGINALHERLKDIDLPLYEKLSANDTQRVTRALEVFYMTGRPMSSFYNDKKDACPFEPIEFVLMPKSDRAQLRILIRQRFLKMLDDGLIDEVHELLTKYNLTLDYPSLRSVGYRQVYEYLIHEYDYDTMIEKSVIATAHLAKHQMTWLRGSLKNKGTLLPIADPNNLDFILQRI